MTMTREDIERIAQACENAELGPCEHSAHLHWHVREGARPGDVLPPILSATQVRDLATTAIEALDYITRLQDAQRDDGKMLRTAEARCKELERLLAHVPLHADPCKTCDEIGENRYDRTRI